MEEEYSKINFTEIEENMKPYHLVFAIYEVRDNQAEKDKEYTSIIINEKILDMIDTINLTYIKDGLEPTNVIKKVAYLNNLQVYLDPHRETNNITFTNDNDEKYELEVIL